MIQYTWLIPVFPLTAFLINIFFGKKLGGKAAWVSVTTSILACLFAAPVIYSAAQGHVHSASFPWLVLSHHILKMGYLIDPMSATLLFVVTFVGTLIQIYSVGYMHGDPRFSRFFAYVSLFMFAMLTLVISDNYILFFIAWEIMGLCSYLLIGFWFEKDSAANASRKAFLTTKVGDIGFFLGLLALYVAAGTWNFSELGHMLDAHHGHAQLLHHPLLPVAALLIFCGTIGKSAQFPLHVWLPDAMEGPTSVSALIHAATMVAAGVFLVARSFIIFVHFPNALMVVATIGTITALMAALIAITQTDIKKVLAYSTISQLGFMVAALGLGSLAAGIFHLMTHAFFKALLFLGAGSVIHGTGTQDIRELGGLFKKMKSTATTFIIASVAIAGVPPLAGFWSKDEILAAAFASDAKWIYYALSFAAFLTAFYMFRLVFLTFFGKPKNFTIHPHESPAIMTVPLWILAIGSILLGFPGSPFMNHWFQNFLNGPHHHGEHVINIGVMISSIVIGLTAILMAYIFYLKKPSIPEKLAKNFEPLYQLSLNKFYYDEIYAACIVRPFHALGRLLFKFDQSIVDGIVDGTGSNTLRGSTLHDWVDKYIVDGLVNLVGHMTQFFSSVLRRIQTGFVQNYLLFAFIAVVIFLIFEIK